MNGSVAPVFSAGCILGAALAGGATGADTSWDYRFCPVGVSSTVLAIAEWDDATYVGGEFTIAGGTAANRIAMWRDGRWHALGSGLNGPVRAMAVWSNALFVGGEFTTAGGLAADYATRFSPANGRKRRARRRCGAAAARTG